MPFDANHSSGVHDRKRTDPESSADQARVHRPGDFEGWANEPETVADAPNRSGLDRTLVRAVAADVPVALLFVDVDRFHAIVEEHGRAAAERTLAALSRVLREHSRKGDFVARYGCEQFGVMLRSAGHDEATALAERVRAAVERLAAPSDLPRFTVTIGVAFREAGSQESADELVWRADLALYEAKAGGENRIVNAPGLAKARPAVTESGVPAPRSRVSAA